jgi:hypothetical protein
MPATIAYDLVATDGRAIRRGYLELILDEYHGDGASGASEAGAPLATAILHLLEKTPKEQPKDQRVFKTCIPLDLDSEQRKRCIVGLMNRLVDSVGVSAFTDDLDSFEEQLTEFGKYAEMAEPSWFN